MPLPTCLGSKGCLCPPSLLMLMLQLFYMHWVLLHRQQYQSQMTVFVHAGGLIPSLPVARSGSAGLALSKAQTVGVDSF